MYLWQPVAGAFYPPCVDGDYDDGVIGHEYGHMIENRMIGKGPGRVGFPAGSMGEAVGDLMAIERAQRDRLVPTGGENRYADRHVRDGQPPPRHPQLRGELPVAGRVPDAEHVSAGRPAELQRHRLRHARARGPRRRRDLGRDQLRGAQGAQRKYDGDFPSSDQALQLRCANNQLTGRQVPGQPALDPAPVRLLPARPGEPEHGRRAGLDAVGGLPRFNGADLPQLRAAFARRGLGEFASSTTGTGRVAGVENDTNPAPDFEADGQSNAPVTFEATSTETGDAAVKARIYVGHYEARVSPIADTDPATNARRRAAERQQPRRDGELRAGHVRVHRHRSGLRRGPLPPDVHGGHPGARAPLRAQLGLEDPGCEGHRRRRDRRDKAAGVVVQPRPQVLDQLIDDTEATDWQAAATQGSDGAWNVDGTQRGGRPRRDRARRRSTACR